MSFDCPKCSEKLKLQTTKRESQYLTKRYYTCLNYQCSVKTLRSYEELEEKPVVFDKEHRVRTSAEKCRQV